MSLQRKVSPERNDQEQTLVMGVTTSYFIKQTVFLSSVNMSNLWSLIHWQHRIESWRHSYYSPDSANQQREKIVKEYEENIIHLIH